MRRSRRSLSGLGCRGVVAAKYRRGPGAHDQPGPAGGPQVVIRAVVPPGASTSECDPGRPCTNGTRITCRPFVSMKVALTRVVPSVVIDTPSYTGPSTSQKLAAQDNGCAARAAIAAIIGTSHGPQSLSAPHNLRAPRKH